MGIGEGGGGGELALEIESFVGPCEIARADFIGPRQLIGGTLAFCMQ